MKNLTLLPELEKSLELLADEEGGMEKEHLLHILLGNAIMMQIACAREQGTLSVEDMETHKKTIEAIKIAYVDPARGEAVVEASGNNTVH